VGDSRKQRKITHHDIILFCNKKKAKRWKPTKAGRESRLKDTGSRKFGHPSPPPYLSYNNTFCGHNSSNIMTVILTAQ